MRDASGTLLMTERACTSKNVMPRKPGVSNERATAPRSNSAGGPGPPPWIRMASHRITGKLEQLFPCVKHLFDYSGLRRGRPRRGGVCGGGGRGPGQKITPRGRKGGGPPRGGAAGGGGGVSGGEGARRRGAPRA